MSLNYFLTLAIAAFTAAPIHRDSVPDAIAFVHVSVIPMDRERVLVDQTVVIVHGQITAMGPASAVQIPAHARHIDGRGKFLAPGLADMHVHFAPQGPFDVNEATRAMRLLVANGITTVRNMDYQPHGESTPSSDADILRLRARVQSREVLGPRIYTSGWWGFPIYGADESKIDSDTISMMEVTRRVAAYKAAGYDFLKVHDENPVTYRQVMAAANQFHVRVAGHVPEGVSLGTVLAAHQSSIEHLKGYVPMMRDTSQIPAVVAATKAAGVWQCPTLIAAEWYDRSTPTQPPQPGTLQAAFDAFLRNGAPTAGYGGTLPGARRLTKAFQDGGVGLLAGSDVSGDSSLTGGFPGFGYGVGLQEELQAFVRAGLTPYQALATATRNVAEYLGTLQETGTVEVGKRADLILLNGNPLLNIQNTMMPAGVVLNGRWFSREDINRWPAH